MDSSDTSLDSNAPEENCSETSMESDENGAYAFGILRRARSEFVPDVNPRVRFGDEPASGDALSDSTASYTRGYDDDNFTDDDGRSSSSRNSDYDGELNTSQGVLERSESRSESDSGGELAGLSRLSDLNSDVLRSMSEVEPTEDAASSSRQAHPADPLAQGPAEARSPASVGRESEEHRETNMSSDVLSSEEEGIDCSGGSRVRDIARVLNNSNGSYSQVLANSALEDMGSSARAVTTNFESENLSLDCTGESRELSLSEPEPPLSFEVMSSPPRSVRNQENHSSQSSWNLSSDNIASSSSADGSTPPNFSAAFDLSSDVMEAMINNARSNLNGNVASSSSAACAGDSSGSPRSEGRGDASERQSDAGNQNGSNGEGSPGGSAKSKVKSNSKSPNVTPSKDTSAKAPGSPVSEETCCICLGNITDACVAGSCLHRFCFPCLKQWSERKAECPLCKNKFDVIIHDIKGEQDYKEYKVVVKTRNFNNLMELSFSIMLQSSRDYFFPRAYEPPLPRVRVPFNALTFRIRIYTNDLWVRFTTANDSVRICSPRIFREQPALTHRIMPFIRRDMRALRADQSLVSTIMDLLARHRIQSAAMKRALTPHLRHKTSHFLHELNCFAHSSYDLTGYDSAVRTRYSDFSLRESPPPSIDSDEEQDEQPHQPESVEIDLTDDTTPEPPPTNTTQETSAASASSSSATGNLCLTIPSNTEFTLTARRVPSGTGSQARVQSPIRLLPRRRMRFTPNLDRAERTRRKHLENRRRRERVMALCTRSAPFSNGVMEPVERYGPLPVRLDRSENPVDDDSASTTLVVSSGDEEGGPTASENASATASENASASASENASATASENASATASENASATASENASATASENASATASENASATASENASTTASENASATASENASATASENASATASKNITLASLLGLTIVRDRNYPNIPTRARCSCRLEKSSSKNPSSSCKCSTRSAPVAESSDSEECLIVEEKKPVSTQQAQSSLAGSNAIESIVLSDSSSDDEARKGGSSGTKFSSPASSTSCAEPKVDNSESSLNKFKPVKLDRQSFSVSGFQRRPWLGKYLKFSPIIARAKSKRKPCEPSSDSAVKRSSDPRNDKTSDGSPIKREPKDDPSRIKRSHGSKAATSTGSATASSSSSSSSSWPTMYESSYDLTSKPGSLSSHLSYKNDTSVPRSTPLIARVEAVQDRVNVSDSLELTSPRKVANLVEKNSSENSGASIRSDLPATGEKRNRYWSDDEPRASSTSKFQEQSFSSDTESNLPSVQQLPKRKKCDSNCSTRENSKNMSSTFLNIARAARPVISDSDSDSESPSHHRRGSSDRRSDEGQVSSPGLKTYRRIIRYGPADDFTSDSSDSDFVRKESQSKKRKYSDNHTSSRDKRERRLSGDRSLDDSSEMDRPSRSTVRKRSKSKKKKKDRKKSKSRDRASRYKHKKSSKSSHKKRRRDSD